MKPLLLDTTLVAIDTTPKAHLALKAIERSLSEIEVTKVKFLTNKPMLAQCVINLISKLEGLKPTPNSAFENCTSISTPNTAS